VKVPNYKVAKLPKLVFFFLRWASSKLSDSLSKRHQTATFYTEQCTIPLPFYKFEVIKGA